MDRDLKKEDLMNLDKQTLITMLMMATSSNDLLQKTVEQLNQTVSNLTEEVALLRQNRFGRKSEKKLAEADGQYVLIFNETEVTIDLYKDDTGIFGPETEETETVSYVRKKHSGKRKEDLSRIREREVINHELSEYKRLGNCCQSASCLFGASGKAADLAAVCCQEHDPPVIFSDRCRGEYHPCYFFRSGHILNFFLVISEILDHQLTVTPVLADLDPEL